MENNKRNKAEELLELWLKKQISQGEHTAFHNACEELGITKQDGMGLLTELDELQNKKMQEKETLEKIQETIEENKTEEQKFAIEVQDEDLDTDDKYFAYKAISASLLKQFYKSPVDGWNSSPWNINKKDFKASDALVIGSLQHCLLLEPELFKEQFYVTKEEGFRRGNKLVLGRGTNAYEDFIELNKKEINGRKVIKPSEYKQAKIQINFLKKVPAVAKIIDGAKPEIPFTVSCDRTGMPLKGKLDIIKRTANGDIIVMDYKTTGRFTDFINISKEGWDIQVGMYAKLILAKFGKLPAKFVFILQSNIPDEENKIKVMEIAPSTIETSIVKVNQLILEYAFRLDLVVNKGVNGKIAFIHLKDQEEPEIVAVNSKEAGYWQGFDEWCKENKSFNRQDYENERPFLDRKLT